MLQRGVIQPSQSAFASPIMLAVKPPGKKIRFCIDYRNLGGSKYFSTLDMTEAFWSIPIRKEDRHKTAFVSRSGLWEWISMPFGLTNTPATQQRFMDMILAGLRWETCIVYVDDIVVFFRKILKHIMRLEIHASGIYGIQRRH
mmetsp:Transcript_9917/g.13370  ORF Transcript_9917/g.13370 Transcript_9917/m.13370 type:complete len:143 (-) Transcript_9917:161-589(-)